MTRTCRWVLGFGELIKLAARQLSSLFFPHPNRHSPAQMDSFAPLLVPDFCTDTGAFLAVYRDGIARSSDPVSSLTRFRVQNITGNKTRTFSEHEHLSVAVEDLQTKQTYNFYIERSSSNRPSNSSPSSTPSPAPTPPQASTVSLASVGAEDYPLLPLNPPSSLPQPTDATPRHSFAQRVTLKSAGSLNYSSSSLDGVAADRILGSAMMDTRIGQIILQIKPIELSLFELGILVDVVHNEAPDYSVLQNQCYWFMSTIIEVIISKYGDTLREEAQAPGEYLPKTAGTWRGLQIAAPKEGLLEKVGQRFSVRKEEEFKVVGFYELVICLSTSNNLKGIQGASRRTAS
jgi:hypothetical protein